jgi:restriction endonuclease S subunit
MMGGFEINTKDNTNKIFLVNRSNVLSRLDAAYNYALTQSSLKTHYPTASLGSSFKSYSGGTPSKSNNSYWIGDIPWASPKDFKSFSITTTEDSISEAAVLNSATTVAPKGALLMVVRSGVLLHTIPVAVTTKSMAFNQDVKAFISNGRISTEYLGIYFKIYNDEILPLVVKHSTTVQSINTAELNAFRLPVLPQKEQQKIVDLFSEATLNKQKKEQQAQALLDSIDTYLLNELGITLTEQDNSLKKRMFNVSFSEMIGQRIDPFHSLKYKLLFSQKSKYAFVPFKELLTGTPQYGANEEGKDRGSKDDVRYIRITDIDELGNLKNKSWKTAQNIEEQYLLKENDILFARSGSVGRCYIHKEIQLPAIFAGYLIRFKTNAQKLVPDFLFYYCNSIFYKSWVNAIARPGVQANINAEEYKSLLIPLPPVEKQNEIVAHITQIRTQAKQLQTEAAQILNNAKAEIERMILGNTA